VAEELYPFVGRHFLASYVDCDPAALRNTAALRRVFRAAAEASGATIQGVIEHAYEPQGYTLVLLLSESHASIHTYPEHNACFVDLFTCGTSCRPEKFDALLREHLRPASHEGRVFLRSYSATEEPVAGELSQAAAR